LSTKTNNHKKDEKRDGTIWNSVIRHKMLQFIPEMGWIATFLWVISIKLAKHLII
jgi:hypothetical protein